MNTFKLLKTLTETAGPSGLEEEIAAAIKNAWEPYVDSFSSDRVGNLIALKQGRGSKPRNRILLAAHMDEIALMVKQIEAHNGNGFLRIVPVGGVDNRQIFGQTVTVHGKQSLPGVVGCLPAAMLPADRRAKPFGYEDLLIDVGLPFEDVASQVSVGDFVSFRQPLRKLLGKRVTGKALDNRASVAAVAICLEQLSRQDHDWDVVAVATSQEETRLLGAYTSAYSQQPDLAIAIDVGFGKGPGANDSGTFELGGGPILDIGPNIHPGIFRQLQATAKSLEMNVNVGIHTRSSGTDAFALQIAREGVPTGLISIPLRYMHTMVESLDLVDIERSGRLMAEFIAALDENSLDKLAAEMMGDGE